ncbi:acetyl-CoA C-acetyltransferase [Globicatella sp. PHS-GS-PNBC-21-1553]|uniref:acetyl-CoA C-acetyltransferase n=1 Tax=Globicatella sp. PHS-GS-PNBC-21-1553 TaxID=2885764 RepID=UPI00298F397F|nr:acetyl-CoA C-acetyltransferase [Globicatella sp. PHS-GS-PNBC-21-1553]WPC08052.1 acetyl-CoA C-acetyltransferase [Globicatella sp. PHS-GS-PNBC-21-1553]
MTEVVIVSAIRTPIGKFGGVFKNIDAVQLGTKIVQTAIDQLNLPVDAVDEVIMGNVLGAGLGQNIARQIAIKSGLSETTNAYVVNKVCGSGLKSVILGAQSILLGDSEIVIAGGTENMSQAPYLDLSARWGGRLGHRQSIDMMLSDGLTDAFSQEHMGITAENIAEKYQISREQQDEFAASSQQKAAKAIEAGRFKEEIVPISIPQRKGDPIVITTDEGVRPDTTKADLAKLRPAFKKEGSVTAGNASGLNDGAAIVVMMSKEKAERLNLTPLATIKSYATAGVDPDYMGLGPIPATEKALRKANLSVEDLELVEANEAFATQAIAVTDQLQLNPEIVNVNGGAIALGHPIGASGTRVLVTLIHEMMKRDAKNGLATLCIGGGQGISLIVSR